MMCRQITAVTMPARAVLVLLLTSIVSRFATADKDDVLACISLTALVFCVWAGCLQIASGYCACISRYRYPTYALLPLLALAAHRAGVSLSFLVAFFASPFTFITSLLLMDGNVIDCNSHDIVRIFGRMTFYASARAMCAWIAYKGAPHWIGSAYTITIATIDSAIVYAHRSMSGCPRKKQEIGSNPRVFIGFEFLRHLVVSTGMLLILGAAEDAWLHAL